MILPEHRALSKLLNCTIDHDEHQYEQTEPEVWSTTLSPERPLLSACECDHALIHRSSLPDEARWAKIYVGDIDSGLSGSVPISNSLVVPLHTVEHLFEVPEQVKNDACCEGYLKELSRRSALNQVLIHVEHVVKGAEVEHDRVEGASVGAMGLHSRKDKDKSCDGQDNHHEPLGDLVHHNAMVVNQVDFLLIDSAALVTGIDSIDLYLAR